MVVFLYSVAKYGNSSIVEAVNPMLGDDFISKSRFRHEVDQEIEVDYFDDEKYAEGFTQSISEKEMYEILELCF